mmetsp:Transcript_76324/g.218698  ORF Transcript_76324/g.218698 Transcript_76324/m.218698 type:complete len:88 (-) Transcript_76324:81-344(-)
MLVLKLLTLATCKVAPAYRCSLEHLQSLDRTYRFAGTVVPLSMRPFGDNSMQGRVCSNSLSHALRLLGDEAIMHSRSSAMACSDDRF